MRSWQSLRLLTECQPIATEYCPIEKQRRRRKGIWILAAVAPPVNAELTSTQTVCRHYMRAVSQRLRG